MGGGEGTWKNLLRKRGGQTYTELVKAIAYAQATAASPACQALLEQIKIRIIARSSVEEYWQQLEEECKESVQGNVNRQQALALTYSTHHRCCA